MSFNPIKCEVIRICKRMNQIHNRILLYPWPPTRHRQVQEVHWRHSKGQPLMECPCRPVTRKTNTSLAFLRRNLSSCPSHTKAQSYQSLVRPILEYALTVWDPYTQTNINRLEAVQRRATRPWFDCHLPGCSGFIEYFPAARPRTTLVFLHHKTADQNASLYAEFHKFIIIIMLTGT